MSKLIVAFRNSANARVNHSPQDCNLLVCKTLLGSRQVLPLLDTCCMNIQNAREHDVESQEEVIFSVTAVKIANAECKTNFDTFLQNVR
jgi:hypothetical protein